MHYLLIAFFIYLMPFSIDADFGFLVFISFCWYFFQDGPSHGKFAGVGPDSVLYMADQVGYEINSEAATNLAEDVSYKLRQTISVSVNIYSVYFRR